MSHVKVISLIALISITLLLGVGCSKYVPREIDISEGEYYSDEEYQKLSGEDREEYCQKLAQEMEELKSRSETAQEDLESNKERIEKLTENLREASTEYSRLNTKIDELSKRLQELSILPKSHVFEYGECLWTLAGYEEIYGDPVKWTRIWRANYRLIEDPDWVLAGWEVKIPRDWPDTHQVIWDEWLARIAGYWEIYDNYKKWTIIYEANKDKIDDPDLIYPGQELVIPREESDIE